MKFSFSALCLGVLPLALSESIIVSYSKDTPKSVVNNAKQSIIDGVCSLSLSLSVISVI